MVQQQRILPSTDSPALVPFLFWDGQMLSADGAALACPQCADSYLHLDVVHVVGTVNNGYTPGPGLEINPYLATASGSDEPAALHAEQNRGSMLSIRYWCEQGCRGRIVWREHKGQLYASLHNEPPGRPEGGEPATEEEPSSAPLLDDPL